MKMKKIFILCLLFGASIILLKAQLNDSTKKFWYNLGTYDTLIIKNMTVNSKWDDYAPMMLSDNKLYFTSDRRSKEGDKAALAFNEKIYIAKKNDTSWLKPHTTYFFNTDDQTALAGVSFSAGKLFVYKTFGNGDLYFSLKNYGKWTEPRKMKSPINSDAHEQSVAEENGIMVLSSDRGGVEGVHDIFWSLCNKYGNYVDFFPLVEINTNGDEVDVRLNKEGNKLFYASNGSNGLGGYDIFYTEINKSGKWQKAVALPIPINSESNDRYFFDCDSAFFLTSDRPGGKGGDDIYCGYIKTEMPVIVKDTVVVKDIVVIKDTVVINDIVLVKDTNRYVIMDQKLDSAGFKEYYARVQIGAYYSRTVDDFKKIFPSLKTRAIYIESVTTDKGKILKKFILDQKFTTIKEAAGVQQEMWTTHKITDAFVAIYNINNERIAIYNTIKGEFVILKGDQKPVYF